jgi:hypothetical protein
MTTQSNQQAKIDPHRDIPTFSIADPHVEGDVDVIGGEVEVVQGHGLRATGGRARRRGLVEVGDVVASRPSKAGNPPRQRCC